MSDKMKHLQDQVKRGDRDTFKTAPEDVRDVCHRDGISKETAIFILIVGFKWTREKAIEYLAEGSTE